MSSLGLCLSSAPFLTLCNLSSAKIATSIHEQELEGVKVDCAKSIKALEDTIANLQEQIQEKDAR